MEKIKFFPNHGLEDGTDFRNLVVTLTAIYVVQRLRSSAYGAI